MPGQNLLAPSPVDPLRSSESAPALHTGRAPAGKFRGLCGPRILSSEFSFSLQRKSHIVLCQGLGCRSRTGYVVQFGELAALVEGILIREAMEHGSHPPREPLHFPNAPQADLRIGVEQVTTSSVIKLLEGPREYLDVGNRQVQSLGSSRRNDVG